MLVDGDAQSASRQRWSAGRDKSSAWKRGAAFVCVRLAESAALVQQAVGNADFRGRYMALADYAHGVLAQSRFRPRAAAYCARHVPVKDSELPPLRASH